MKLLLFGLPISLHRRLKEESKGWVDAVPAGNTFSAIPVQSNEFKPFSEADLLELEGAVGSGFNHIVIPAVRNWTEIRRRWEYDCRIHLSRLREPLRDLTWPILREHLRTVVMLDEDWMEKFCPRDLRHALLLPPPVFAPGHEMSQYWRHCDVYKRERFAPAERMLAAVVETHLRADSKGGRSWLDLRRRRFRVDPSKHGRSAADRAGAKSYRFCFEVPPGFHYDVTDEGGRTFRIEIDGRAEDVMHCNVTPWGRVRRG